MDKERKIVLKMLDEGKIDVEEANELLSSLEKESGGKDKEGDTPGNASFLKILVVEDGEIAAVEEAATDSTDIVLPAFVNAHTHIGDSIAKEAGGGLSLDDLVAPPDGLKHRLLRQASREEKVTAMARSLRFMEDTGTAAFLEFREGGVAGVD
ncbi:MAG: SHOCT-like domain-containing protein, partial [Candidatus Bipolaricaulota bacterium]